MKMLGTFILILILSISFSLLMDILLGFKISHALMNLLNPFWVTETGEYVMFAFFILITIGHQIAIYKKNKANKQNGTN